MKPRKIIHIDMDCFYAAIEVRDNPELKGKPVAVGGLAQGRGVLTTANYEARKFGVRSAQPTAHALRLCPDLILVAPHFDKYKKVSRQIQAIFRQYTDLVEPLSLDEAYLEVTDSPHCAGIATEMARQIRAEIYQETQLTASAGIGPNKFIAKVASDWRKPNGQFTVPPDRIPAFVAALEVKKIPGVGPVNNAKLQTLGIKTCSDLQKLPLTELQNHFGRFGKSLYHYCRGEDHRQVQNNRVRKSLSVERTFAEDLKNLKACEAHLPRLLDELQRRVDRAALYPRISGLILKLKFHDFQQTTIETSTAQISLATFQLLLKEAFARGQRPVRLIGCGVRLRTPQPEKEPHLQIPFDFITDESGTRPASEDKFNDD